jgi:hypothetical protein
MLPKLLKCDLCGKEYKAATGLGIHKLRAHGIPGVSRSSGDYHKQKAKKQTAKAQFACDLCDRTFPRNSELGRHKLAKHGIPGMTYSSQWQRRKNEKLKQEAALAAQSHSTPTPKENIHALTVPPAKLGRPRKQKNITVNHHQTIIAVGPLESSYEGPAAIAVGRFQEVCRSLAYQYELPEKLFAARVTELLYATQVR